MKKNNTQKRSKTNWARIDSMKDEDINYSDTPKLNEDFWKNAVLWQGNKIQITLRLDPEIVAFFKKQGRGYQTTINAVLRKYVETRKKYSMS